MDGTTKGVAAFLGNFDDVPPGGSRKVLVAVGDLPVRLAVTKILDSAGYEVVNVADGSQGLDVLQQHTPAFVIVDWDLPVLDGRAFCRMVRLGEFPQYVYIIMLSAAYTDRLAEGLSCGANDFITTPVKEQELLAKMQSGERVLKLEETLRRLARYDPLTELLNRRAFSEIFQTEWSRSCRIGYPLCCVMIDIDFFKNINDTHGHLTGDAVLRSVAHRLRESCRETDVVARYGGDELVVLLPGTDEQGAMRWVERCRLAIADMCLSAGETTVRVTISAGIAQRDDCVRTPEKLLDFADRALLEAKELGRNRVIAGKTVSSEPREEKVLAVDNG